jgi:chromate transporter
MHRDRATPHPPPAVTVRSVSGPPEPARPDAGPVREVARLFLKLGFIGFGGPAAHIAMMREEVVRRREWLDDAEFLDLVGATNLIPGPNSTELAIHLGHRRAGGRGLLVAGFCFIMPAVAIVAVLAWLYERYGTDPTVVDLRYGVIPVVIGIVAHALYGLGKTALTGVLPALIAAAAVGAYLLDVHELLVLVAAGCTAAAWAARDQLSRRQLPAFLALPLAAAASSTDQPVSLRRLFLVFLEIGSVLYGSGYVLLAFLQRNLVDHYGWLTKDQLLDAVTVGQITPGPVFTTATFVGWQIDGAAGAAVATIGIFLPSFLFVALLGRIVPWMRARPMAKAFLSGVTAASLGLMAGVLIELADDALTDLLTVALALAALGVLLRTKLNSAWLIAGGLAVGALHTVAT